MGWSFNAHPTTKAAYVAELRRGYESAGHSILAHKVAGKECWWLVQLSPSAPKDPGLVLIVLDLLDSHGGCWGSKGMEEAMHPYYYACPVAWLDRAPVGCAAWRAGVHQWHADKAAAKARHAALSVGVPYRVPEGWKLHGRQIASLVLSSLKPAQGVALLAGSPTTVPCRVSRRLLSVLVP